MSNIRVQNNKNKNKNKANIENIDSFLYSQRIRYEEQQQIDLDALYLTLHIGIHNINGLAGDNAKLYGILSWMQENQQFHIYWSSKQNNKHKGSGVALICSRKWNKHYQGHKFHSPYLLSAYFLFRNVLFCIWIVYASPQIKTILHDTLELLKREMSDKTIKKKSINIVHILMGDFNLISNGHIDRTLPQHISKPKIFNDLEAMGFIDSYRKLNKEVPGNTYHREGVSTRIDQIWISENINQEVIEDKVNIKEYSQEDIDRYWNKLNSVIVSAADSELLRKVIRLHNTFIRYNKKKMRPERHTNKLLKLLHNYYYGNQQMTTSVGAKSR
ncbi:unnamed protein product [Rhizophagus irregularis]|nr:unnamed protein product [Rhizophagus irregularis]